VSGDAAALMGAGLPVPRHAFVDALNPGGPWRRASAPLISRSIANSASILLTASIEIESLLQLRKLEEAPARSSIPPR
jgi:hypothetical protein